MKKKLICSMMVAILGVFTLIPNTAFAETVKEDVNKDGVVSFEDYNLVLRSNGSNGSYDLNIDYKVDQKDLDLIKSAIVPSKIKGDVNSDGVISIEDDNLYTAIFEQAHYKIIDVNGVGQIIADPTTVTLGYDLYNFDMNNNGYIDTEDQVIFHDTYKLESTNLKGDVNNDGIVDRKDLVLLGSYVSTPFFNVDQNNSDLNNDGKIDNADYDALKLLVK